MSLEFPGLFISCVNELREFGIIEKVELILSIRFNTEQN